VRSTAPVCFAALAAGVHLAAPVVAAAVVLGVQGTRARLAVAAAVVSLAAVGLPPLHGAAEASVTGHMVQHLVIVLVAAPCLGFALAGGRGFRLPGTARGDRTARSVARVLVRSWWAPLAAGAVHLATLVLWHVPGPYDAAVDRWPLHGLEHASLLASGVWWWATVVHHCRRRTAAAVAASLLVVAAGGAALGVLMMFARRPLYGQGGVDDQQVAGALMAGVPGLLLGAAALATLAGAVERLSAPTPPRVPPGARRRVARGLSGPMLALVVTGGLAGAALVVQATVDVDGAAAGAPEQEDVELGRHLYGRDCASCHGPDASGTYRGTSLAGTGAAGVEYVLSTGRMPISDPDAPVRRGDPVYDREEIDALVAYAATLVDGPEVPDLDMAAADAARGGEHYRLHCAACHSGTGIGGALTDEAYAPSVLHSTPTEVASAVVVGPGTMPEFGTRFDDDDLADIAAYVELVQDPPTRGVAVPGSRVGEGLVGWVVGMGVLVVALRWIGKRT
jgi:ubiquinol-cytochrome c reductase cytochrome c subunit